MQDIYIEKYGSNDTNVQINDLFDLTLEFLRDELIKICENVEQT